MEKPVEARFVQTLSVLFHVPAIMVTNSHMTVKLVMVCQMTLLILKYLFKKKNELSLEIKL